MSNVHWCVVYKRTDRCRVLRGKIKTLQLICIDFIFAALSAWPCTFPCRRPDWSQDPAFCGPKPNPAKLYTHLLHQAAEGEQWHLHAQQPQLPWWCLGHNTSVSPFLCTWMGDTGSTSRVTWRFPALLTDSESQQVMWKQQTHPRCLFSLVSTCQASFQPQHYRCLTGPYRKPLNLAINTTEPPHRFYHWSMFHFIKCYFHNVQNGLV